MFRSQVEDLNKYAKKFKIKRDNDESKNVLPAVQADEFESKIISLLSDRGSLFSIDGAQQAANLIGTQVKSREHKCLILSVLQCTPISIALQIVMHKTGMANISQWLQVYSRINLV